MRRQLTYTYLEEANALLRDEHPAPPSQVQLVAVVTSNLDSSLQSIFNSLPG